MRLNCILFPMQDCKRKADYVYIFPYSKYETKVDVGICVGQCSNRTGISMDMMCINTDILPVYIPH